MPPPITSGLLWSTDVAIDFAASGPVVPAIPMPRAAGPLYCVVSAETAGSEGVIFRVGNPEDNFHVQNTFQAERWDGLYGLMAAPGWPNQVIGEAPAISVTADHLWEFWFSSAGTDFIDHQPFGFVNSDLQDQDVAASSHLFIGYRPNEGSPMDRAAGTIRRMAIYDRVPDAGERAQLVAWVNGDDATGGTITTAIIDGVEYRIHTFAEDGEFVALAPLDVEYFLVGGGGCGWSQGSGNAFGGGAAGGRVIHNFGSPLRISGGVHPVTVGPGGPGGLSNTVEAKQGGDTVFAGITAAGGEMGQGARGGNQRGDGGRIGGIGQGGGGAGDGENGQDAAGAGGKGGDGSYHNPDGNPRHFGGGGGGRTGGIEGAGGLGGGTSGTSGASAPGTDGLGGGTGSSRGSGDGAGKGGDGIVIIRYRTEAGPGGATIDRQAGIVAASHVAAQRTVRRQRSAVVVAGSAVAASASVSRRRGAQILATSSLAAAAAPVRDRVASVGAGSTVAAHASVSRLASATLSARSAVSAQGTITRTRSAMVGATSALSATAGVSGVISASASIKAASSVQARPSRAIHRSAVIEAGSSVRAGSGRSVHASVGVIASSAIAARARRIVARGVTVTAAGAVHARAEVQRGSGITIAARSSITAQRRVLALRAANVSAASVVAVAAIIVRPVTRYAYPGDPQGGVLGPSARGGVLAPSTRSGTITRP